MAKKIPFPKLLINIGLTVIITALLSTHPDVARPLEEVPELIITAPSSLAPLKRRLQGLPPQTFAPMMKNIGLTQPGPPIQILLATNDSEWSQQVPDWFVGYAVSSSDFIVLLADRVPSYPYHSLESVLIHEIAHILVARAAGYHNLPRWFDEGLAMITAHQWDYEDHARLLWAMTSKTPVSMEELNQSFLTNEGSAHRAYVLAHAFLRDLLHHTDPQLPQTILRNVANGTSFNDAFAKAVLMTPNRALERFLERNNLWTRWVPVLTSSTMLWLAMIILALYVFQRQQRRAAAIKQRWRDEDNDF